MYILKIGAPGNPLIFHSTISHVYMYRDTLAPSVRLSSLVEIIETLATGKVQQRPAPTPSASHPVGAAAKRQLA
jgi:hypothetical protein